MRIMSPGDRKSMKLFHKANSTEADSSATKQTDNLLLSLSRFSSPVRYRLVRAPSSGKSSTPFFRITNSQHNSLLKGFKSRILVSGLYSVMFRTPYLVDTANGVKDGRSAAVTIMEPYFYPQSLVHVGETCCVQASGEAKVFTGRPVYVCCVLWGFESVALRDGSLVEVMDVEPTDPMIVTIRVLRTCGTPVIDNLVGTMSAKWLQRSHEEEARADGITFRPAASSTTGKHTYRAAPELHAVTRSPGMQPMQQQPPESESGIGARIKAILGSTTPSTPSPAIEPTVGMLTLCALLFLMALVSAVGMEQNVSDSFRLPPTATPPPVRTIDVGPPPDEHASARTPLLRRKNAGEKDSSEQGQQAAGTAPASRVAGTGISFLLQHVPGGQLSAQDLRKLQPEFDRTVFQFVDFYPLSCDGCARTLPGGVLRSLCNMVTGNRFDKLQFLNPLRDSLVSVKSNGQGTVHFRFDFGSSSTKVWHKHGYNIS